MRKSDSLLILFAGFWLAASQIPAFKFGTARTVVAGTDIEVRRKERVRVMADQGIVSFRVARRASDAVDAFK